MYVPVEIVDMPSGRRDTSTEKPNCRPSRSERHKICFQQFPVHQHPDDSSTKYLDHRVQATERNVVEGAFIIESTFEHDRMKMWVPSKHVAEGLMGDHDS